MVSCPDTVTFGFYIERLGVYTRELELRKVESIINVNISLCVRVCVSVCMFICISCV